MRRTVCLLILNAFLFLSASAEPQRTEIKIDPKAFDEFVGQYDFADNPDVVLSFGRAEDRADGQRIPCGADGVRVLPSGPGGLHVLIYVLP